MHYATVVGGPRCKPCYAAGKYEYSSATEDSKTRRTLTGPGPSLRPSPCLEIIDTNIPGGSRWVETAAVGRDLRADNRRGGGVAWLNCLLARVEHRRHQPCERLLRCGHKLKAPAGIDEHRALRNARVVVRAWPPSRVEAHLA